MYAPGMLYHASNNRTQAHYVLYEYETILIFFSQSTHIQTSVMNFRLSPLAIKIDLPKLQLNRHTL